MDEAEKQCRKFHMGSNSWSPTYKKARWTLEYWRQRHKYELGLHTNVKALRTIQRKAKLKYDPSLTIQQIIQEIIKATRQYKTIKEKSDLLSKEYRYRLANAKEEAGEIKAAIYLRNYNRMEAQRRLFRNIKYVENKIKGGATVQIRVKDKEGNDVDYTDRDNIEKLILENIEGREHQTEGGSQLLNQPFLNDLGKYGEGPKVWDVINGEYNFPPETNDATKDFLLCCKQSPHATNSYNSLDIAARYNNFINSWKVRKEKTTSFNQHIGHYKACASHPFLSWLLFQQYEIPQLTAYSPTCFQRCTDQIIAKQNQA